MGRTPAVCRAVPWGAGTLLRDLFHKGAFAETPRHPDTADRAAEGTLHSHGGDADEHRNAGYCDRAASVHGVRLELAACKRALYRLLHWDAGRPDFPGLRSVHEGQLAGGHP